MYSKLLEHIKRLENGETFPKFYHEHIWDSHYDQMQFYLYTYEKQYCYYIVNCITDDTKFLEIVEYNPEYCEYMYKKSDEWLTNSFQKYFKL